MGNQLVIINNESIFQDNDVFLCDNVDMKSIPDGLSRNFEVTMISRKSNIKRFHQINLREIKLTSNIFTYLFSILKTFKQKEKKYLLISITPYTFFAYLILFIFRSVNNFKKLITSLSSVFLQNCQYSYGESIFLFNQIAPFSVFPIFAPEESVSNGVVNP